MDMDGGANGEECEVPLLNTHTKAEVDAAYRKVAWKLLPFTFLMTVVCYVDRTNISLAAVDMSSDIGLTKSQFGVASSLFFITYIVFQVPSNAILKRVGGPLWLGTLLIGWGLAASLTAFVSNATELYVLRLVLGIFEAGTFPGLLLYLSEFFPNSRTPGVYGITISGCTIGMMISGLVAAGFLSMDGVLHFRGWQWLLFLEGLPALILGAGIMFYLPKSPESKGFLTETERMILKSDRPSPKTPVDGKSNGFLYLLKTIVLNSNLFVMLFCCLLVCTMRYVAMFWTPLWIDAMVNSSGLDWEQAEKAGDSGNGVQVALLSTIPYALASFSTAFFGWTSEKLRDRTIHMFCLWLLGGLSFLLLPWLAGVNVILGFFALLCGHVGVNGIWGPFTALALTFMTDENKGFGLAWVISVGNLGGVFGPMLAGLLADRTGSYKSAIMSAGAMTVIAAVAIVFIQDAARKDRRKSRV